MKKIYSLILLSFALMRAMTASTQVQPDGGGSYKELMDVKDEITPQQRAAIITKLKQSETLLRRQGKLKTVARTTVTAFAWPIQQAPGYNDNGYYGISNYIDQNASYPNAILDYNCGNRSYDLSSGYNHKGTDIFTWPYSWQKMARNAVQIIAAAPGTILYKSDGNTDQNCAFCSGPCDWNAVYVMHADGSVAWYGHMKSGSLTTKTVGQTVATGEYLGVVGSSGNSTGPHLHFEVYTSSSYTQLVDPWAGPCNSLNGTTSWWAAQQPYYMPTLSKVMTHSAAPLNNSCPSGEVVNEKINFVGGETIFLGSYYRDQQSGHQSVHTIYRPDGSVYLTWNQSFTAYYSASWWYYSRTLPNPAPPGTWRYEIVYNATQRQTAYFAVGSAAVQLCGANYNVLTSNVSGSTYQWQINTGSGFANISAGANYAGITSRQLQLQNIPTSFYGYQYRCLVNGTTYSETISLKFVSYWTGGAGKAWENPANWSCGNVPDANTDVVIPANTNMPEVSSNTFCRSTVLNAGANITVKSGYKLTVTH